MLFIFVNMGPNRIENFKRLLLQIVAENFCNLLVLNFPPKGVHKTTLGIIEILSVLFLTIFFRR